MENMPALENIIGSVMSSPESMEKVMDIVKMFGGEKPQEKALPAVAESAHESGLSPEMLAKIGTLISDYNASDDRRIKLLNALRPWMNETEHEHIEKAIRIVKLSRTAKNAYKNLLENRE